MKIIQGEEILYRGLYIPLKKVKRVVEEEFPREVLRKYQIDKSFDKSTGNISYKYAWDSILHDNENKVKVILNRLIDE